MILKRLYELSKNLITSSTTEWEKIKAQSHKSDWILMNCAIPFYSLIIVAYFVGKLLNSIGGSITENGWFQMGNMYIIADLVLRFGIHLVVLYSLAFLLGYVNGGFSVSKDKDTNFRFVFYSLVPVYVAYIFAGVIPAWSDIFIIIGLISIYLLWTGAKLIMEVGADKIFPYLISIVVLYLLVFKLYNEIFNRILRYISSIS